MFYGIPPGKQPDFRMAMDKLTKVYPGNIFANDMLITIGRNLSFRSDSKFMSSFASSAREDQQKSLIWRLHVLAWAAQAALSVDGDFVECGVLKGFCSEVICKYLDFQKVAKQYFLYDTFSGFPEKTSTKEERSTYPSYKKIDGDALYEEVCAKFSAYPNIRVVRGIVPDSFAEASPAQISFLHIDMNSEMAEVLALEHLFDRVTAGGIIVFDDFGWNSAINQCKAELAFMRKRGLSILELPTGQGLVIKHG